MRGQSKKQMSLEESCRAGACPRRLFLVCAGNFAACGRRGTFPAMGKHPKDRRGTPQRRTSFANDGLPPVPHYGGRVPESRQKISGAQNLWWLSAISSGAWLGPGFPKITVGAVPHLRLPSPNQRARRRIHCRGGSLTRPPRNIPHCPYAFPLGGEGAPVRTLGRMRGRFRPPYPKRRTLTKPLPAPRGPARTPSYPPGG